MSTRVCVLAPWEADDYAKNKHPSCRNHRHFLLETARQMVNGATGMVRDSEGNEKEIKIPPTAKWVGTGERRITTLAQPPEKLRDMSARLGFDGQGNTIDGSSIGQNSADLIGVMLSESRRRLPSTSSRMRTGNSGGDGSFLEGRKR